MYRQNGNHLSQKPPLLRFALEVRDDDFNDKKRDGTRLWTSLQICPSRRSTTSNGLVYFSLLCSFSALQCSSLIEFFIVYNVQVIVSSAAKKQLQEHVRELRRRAGQKKATGVFKLKPDYDHFMKPVEKGKRDAGIYPASDFDLDPYRRKWKATEKSCDLENEETCKNRYMLIGRPQIGKTGVFLAISYLLWQKVGSPQFTGPEMEKPSKILVENCDEEEEEDETEANTRRISGVPGKRRLLLNPEFAREYPDFRHIRSRSLLKPNLSKRYGDPNDKDTQDWYASGKTYPPVSFLKGNSLLKRRHPDRSGSPGKHTRPDSPKRTGNLSGRPHLPRLKAVEVSQNRFSAKRITPVEEISDTELGSRVRSCFSRHSIDHWGTLYTQKSEEAGKWVVTRDTSTSPTVAQLRLE